MSVSSSSSKAVAGSLGLLTAVSSLTPVYAQDTEPVPAPPETVSEWVPELAELDDVVEQDLSPVLRGVLADGGFTVKAVSGESAREFDGVLWFTDTGTKTVSLRADTDHVLGDISVSVDGREVYSSSDVDKSFLEFSLNDVLNAEGRYKVQVFLDGKEVESVQVGIDATAPVALSAEVTPGFERNDDYTFVQEGSEVTLSGISDPSNGVGVESVRVEVDSSGDGSFEVLVPSVTDNRFPVSVSGVYRVIITDKLGHEYSASLGSLLGSPEAIEVRSVSESSISYTVDSESPKDSWYKDTARVGVQIRTDGLFQSNEVFLNGESVKSENIGLKFGGSSFYDFDLSQYTASDGVYTFETVSRGLFGSEKRESLTVRVDKADPSLSDVTINGAYEVVDGVIYAKEPLTGTIRAEDSESGIKSVSLNGTALQGENGVYSFTLNAGDSFVFTAEDNVGHKVVASITEKGLASGKVEIDGEAPVLTRITTPEVRYVDDSSRQWVRSIGDFGFRVDDKFLADARVFVNGVEVHRVTDSGEHTVDLSAHTVADGEYTILVVARDKAGNVVEDTVSYVKDSTSPHNVGISFSGDVVDRGYGVFAKSPVAFGVSGADSGSGVREYRFLDAEGRQLGVSGAGAVSIPEGAVYVYAVDNVGNESERLSIADLLGWSHPYVVVDSSAPALSVDRSGTVYESWSKDSVSWDIRLSDSVSVHSLRVLLNGREVHAWVTESVRGEYRVSVSTDGVPANADGSYDLSVLGVDSAGNEVEYSDRVFVDSVAPTVDRFVFNGGRLDGSDSSNAGEYGFFFQGATSVDIYASDGAPASGVSAVFYELVSSSGAVVASGEVATASGIATVGIPADFKGFIRARAVDRVGNTSDFKSPSGIVTETRNWHVNTSSIDIAFADTEHRDANGNPLFNRDTTATLRVTDSVAGVQSIDWGFGDSRQSVGVPLSGGGVDGWSVDGRDSNLVTALSRSLYFSSDVERQRVWVRVVDNAGHVSESERFISIDKTAPTVSVDWDKTVDSGFYNSNRVATVTVTDRNFIESGVDIAGGQVSSAWSNVGGDSWRATVVFAEEAEHSLSVSATDRAGNVSEAYRSGSFTIDKTAPVVSVEFDNNKSANGKYFAGARVATLTVADRNFDPSKFVYEGSGVLSSWSQLDSGTWVATVPFDKDGEYHFSARTVDRAGNESVKVDVPEFIVNMTVPDIKIIGVQDGVSYKDDVSVRAEFTGKYIDTASSSFRVVSRKTGLVDSTVNITSTGGSGFIASFPKEKAFDDKYTVYATLNDLSGNRVERELSFTVNRFGSDFVFGHSEFVGKYYQSLPDDVVLKQTTVDEMDLDKTRIQVLRDGKVQTLPDGVSQLSVSGGKTSDYVYEARVAKDFFTQDGIYQVQYFATSVPGVAESTLSQEYVFGIDRTAPEIILSGVESFGSYNSVSVDASFQVNDLSGAESVEVLLDGEPVEATLDDVTGSYRFSVPAGSGERSVAVRVVDKAGNVSEVSAEHFVVTTSVAEYWAHNKWVRSVLGILVLFGLGWLVLLWVNRRRSSAEVVDDSGSTALGSSGSSSPSAPAVPPVEGSVGSAPVGTVMAVPAGVSAVSAPVAFDVAGADSEVEASLEVIEEDGGSSDDVATGFAESDDVATGFAESDDVATGFVDSDDVSTGFVDSEDNS